jgi:DNA-directed RNA polymerase subunit E'/Rpb7
MNKTQPVADKKNVYGVFHRSSLQKKVILKITEIGKTLKQNLERKIVKQVEGKCIAEGYIRPNSVRIVNYSSGNINGEFVEYTVVYECMICYPTEGMIVECTVKTITKAGIHAEVIAEEGIVPLTVFIIRDHNYTNKLFSQIKENMKINVRIVGTRFEINDTNICAIATLVDMGKERAREKNTHKPKIAMMEGEANLDDIIVDMDA